MVFKLCHLMTRELIVVAGQDYLLCPKLTAAGSIPRGERAATKGIFVLL